MPLMRGGWKNGHALHLSSINPVNELLTDLTTKTFSLSGQGMLSLGLFQVYYQTNYDYRPHIGGFRSLNNLLNTTRTVASRCNGVALYGLPLEQTQYLLGGTCAYPKPQKVPSSQTLGAMIWDKFPLDVFLCLLALSQKRSQLHLRLEPSPASK